MTSTPLPWIPDRPIDPEDCYETLKSEVDSWVEIHGNVRTTAARVEDEIWRGRELTLVAYCRRENASLLLAAPKLMAACKQLMSIGHDSAHSDVETAYREAEEAIAEADGGPVTNPATLRLAGYKVKPDAKVPGKWVWQNNFIAGLNSTQSFDSESDAWRNAGETLL